MSMHIKSPTGTPDIDIGSVRVKPSTATKNITQNGTYNASSDNVDGYSAVTVNVPSLSVMDKMILSPDTAPIESILYAPLTAADMDVTCYAVAAAPKSYQNDEKVSILGVPYSMSAECVPCFFCENNTDQVDAAFYGRNITISGVTSDVYHIYTMSLNAATKTARFYVDGVYRLESTFAHSGNVVVVGSGNTTLSDFAGRRVQCKYFGVIEELQSDAEIIAKQQELMEKYGIT